MLQIKAMNLKILNLDVVEMRDLMPENWLCEEED